MALPGPRDQRAQLLELRALPMPELRALREAAAEAKGVQMVEARPMKARAYLEAAPV
jgi:hypothetical protein